MEAAAAFSLAAAASTVLPLTATADGARTGANDRGEGSEGQRLDNNLKCVDLSDLKEDLPLDVTRSRQILWQSEDWEHSTWTPDAKHDSVGYTCLPRNTFT
jgi:hypothetical protein